MTYSAIRGNTARDSGGGLSNLGTLTVTHSTVCDNAATAAGGGFYNNHYGTLTLTTSTVRDNAATEGGGLANEGTLTITYSTLSSNAAGLGGGLINWRSGGALTLSHSTISGNTAAAGGGGLFNFGRLTLTQSTVSSNATNAEGGGIYSSATSALTLTASLVAKNSAGGDCSHLNTHSIISAGYNLDSDGSCHLTTPTDQAGMDPLLGPLQDNGGPTFTHALLPGSPALDAIPWGTKGCGTTRYSDQRWQARPEALGGSCDIGAYEVAVAGQPLNAWVTGVTLRTVVCQNLTTGQEVTLSAPVPPWDCEAAGVAITSGDQVAVRLRGPVQQNATDVGGAVVGTGETVQMRVQGVAE
jgi:hypothetical protein